MFHVVADDKTAREMASKRQERKRTEELLETQKVSLDDFYQRMQEGEVKELNIIVKGDVQGVSRRCASHSRNSAQMRSRSALCTPVSAR